MHLKLNDFLGINVCILDDYVPCFSVVLFFYFFIVDAPGKPEVLDVTKNSVTLVWTKPKNDGGSKIIGYYVEAMRLPGDTWVRCNISSQNVPREEYTATGLEEGAKYQFRVIAKTAVNISRPSEITDPILLSAENGMHFYVL